jgi:hypothetical protein
VNGATLKTLLSQTENPALEFKQELKIYGSGEAVKWQRDELRRDIVSLANGNPRTIGQDKHLIIGRADKPDADGDYELFDIGDKYPTADDLLKLLANGIYPPLNNINSELIEVDGKRLLVITIPPTEYVHETTRKFKAAKRVYTEHTVFMRRDESIVVASASDRAAIRRAKQKFFDEQDDVPPTPYGAALGAFLIGPMIGQQAKKAGFGSTGQVYMTVIGSLVGAFLGGIFGVNYKQLRQIVREWPDLLPQQQTAAVLSMSVYVPLVIAVWQKLFGNRPTSEKK